MNEQRKLKRFSLNFPTEVEITASGQRDILNLVTSDISASGAYFPTSQCFAEGKRLKLTFHVQSDRLKKLTGTQGLIKVDGIVVRSTSTGMAVCFDGDCQVVCSAGAPIVAAENLHYTKI